jgi:membrane associated rhomboid family serine protease
VRAAQPPAAERLRRWNATRSSVVVPAIVVVNVVAFVVQQSVTRFTSDYGINAIAIADGEWYRLVTGGFLHANVMHIAFNMFLIWQLGSMLEKALGAWRFIVLYATSLLVGSAGAVALSSLFGLTIGASTAGFGLMGAFAMLLARRGVNVMSSGIGMTLLLNLGITFLVPNISIGGHLGGLIGGALVALVFPDDRRWKGWPAVAIGVALIVAAFVSGVVIADARVGA